MLVYIPSQLGADFSLLMQTSMVGIHHLRAFRNLLSLKVQSDAVVYITDDLV